MNSIPGRVVFFAVGLLASACAPSEESLKSDFAKVVAASNDCQLSSDCVSAETGCPLGCGAAVNRKQQARVESVARELIKDYERWGRACAYECVFTGPPVCMQDKCTLAALSEQSNLDAGSSERDR
jgi:hypothetical protein